MFMTRYFPRDIGRLLEASLDDMPVVVLTGMRQVGKSTLLNCDPRLKGRRCVTLDDFEQLEAARGDPERFVRSSEPLTIDEAQRCPELLVAIKREVDRDRRSGRFLLSGSANFSLLKGVSESLAGRAVYLALGPLSRREQARETARLPFLRRFFDSPRLPDAARGEAISLSDVLAGGMPSVSLGETRQAPLWFKGFEQTYLERDVRDLSRVGDLVVFRHLMRLAALRTGQLYQPSEVARDAKMTMATATRYLALLAASFVIRLVPPYLANRASRLIKSPKLYFSDSGMACHLAGVESVAALAHSPMAGALFETYAAQNLAAILDSHWPEASLAFWNVQGRHEVDFVVESGAECMAIEVKSSARWTERDLSGLRAFLEASPRCRAAVLATNGSTAVRLGDRLFAIPLGQLFS